MSKPKTRVSIAKEYDKSMFFHITCHCISPECTHILEMEYDKRCNDLEMNIYADIKVHSLYNSNWFIQQWLKVKGIFKIIFGVPLTYTSNIVIYGEDHINDYIEALEHAKAKFKKFKVDDNE